MESIAKTLGSGSGIDVTSLVTQLVEAQTAAKTAQLQTRSATLTAQISAVSQLKNSITGFSTALSTITKGGSLETQPTSSNPTVLGVARQGSANLDGLSAAIEVRQLATAQVTTTAPVNDATAAIGTGTLTLTLGTATVSGGAMTGFTAGSTPPVAITITSANSSLTGIATAINEANAGVTASILSDGNGSRLVLKGKTGDVRAFRLTATEDVGAEGLAALAVGVGATGTSVTSAAGDAILGIDGITIRRAGNRVDDLIQGVRFDLLKAEPGTIVQVGGSRPAEAIRQTVVDLVDAYNEIAGLLKTATDPVSGPLRGDTGARTLARQLASLTLNPLVSGQATGAPTTLAAIGIATNRDGTLSLDSTKFSAAYAAHPQAIEAMFAPNAGVSAALETISKAATSTSTGLGASEARYSASQRTVADEQARATERAEALRARMTQQFAAMDAKVASYKATQSYLENQIDAWNAQR